MASSKKSKMLDMTYEQLKERAEQNAKENARIRAEADKINSDMRRCMTEKSKNAIRQCRKAFPGAKFDLADHGYEYMVLRARTDTGRIADVIYNFTTDNYNTRYNRENKYDSPVAAFQAGFEYLEKEWLEQAEECNNLAMEVRKVLEGMNRNA